MSTPYKLANAWLNDYAEETVIHILPAARLAVNEMLVGDLEGNPGASLHITVKGPKTGWWKDFATGARGRDLCQLWMRVRGIEQNDYERFFAELASFSGQEFLPEGGPEPT